MLSKEDEARNRTVAAIILLTPLYAVGPAELSEPEAAVAQAARHSTFFTYDVHNLPENCLT